MYLETKEYWLNQFPFPACTSLAFGLFCYHQADFLLISLNPTFVKVCGLGVPQSAACQGKRVCRNTRCSYLDLCKSPHELPLPTAGSGPVKTQRYTCYVVTEIPTNWSCKSVSNLIRQRSTYYTFKTWFLVLQTTKGSNQQAHHTFTYRELKLVTD